MLIKFKELWKKLGFEITLGVCIAFILIFALYNKLTGIKGKYSRNRSIGYYKLPPPPSPNQKHSTNHHNLPKESKGELECRKILENKFKKPFKSSRPDFLRNPVTGGRFNLELDCYNPELRLAVEYNGAQHYKYIPYFHKNYEQFVNQKYRDDLKRRLCNDNGIVLIEVPYTIKIHEIKSFLEKMCKTKGF